MQIEVKEGDLKQGVLALVLALVEVVTDALRLEAVRRMDGLTVDENERLGRALMDLDAAIAHIEEEQGIVKSVRDVRAGLDGLVSDLLGQCIDVVASPEDSHGMR